MVDSKRGEPAIGAGKPPLIDHPPREENPAFNFSLRETEKRQIRRALGHTGGNLSRAAFRRDGTTNFNVSVSRSLSISPDQTQTVLLRGELINALNHPQFSPPSFSLTDPNFGQITNTLNSGRIVQFTLRFSF